MRRLTHCLRISLALCVALVLGACNGAAEDSGGVTDDSFKLSISYKTVVNGVCAEPTSDVSFATDSSFCAIASLTQGNSLITGELVSFSASFGSISPETKLTDGSGQAEVIVSNSDGAQGAGQIIASFKPAGNDALTASRNYEFIGSGGNTSADTLSLSASILKDAATVTRFRVDEAVRLQARILDEQSRGIPGVKVTFSAGNATLLPNSALTNDQGIAEVSYTPGGTELGAGTLNVSLEYNNRDYQLNSLFEVLANDAIDNTGTLKLGHFNASNEFVEGELSSSLAKIDGKYIIGAGGSFGVTASLVSVADDGSITRVQTPSAIDFSSDCVNGNLASLDSPVTTLSGSAGSTFQDTSCSGNSERDDIIVATTLVGNQTLTASLPFTLARQTLASLGFVSAEPEQIRIKGAGGTGSSESSLVTFRVTSANGQNAAQQAVNFELDTLVGGLSFANGLATTQALTNSDGLASARVLAGTVPTPVRVVASATDADTGEVITSQSEQLTVNTGLPQQLGFSLSTSVFNPEADDFNGETATITAYASDSFGNPAPDDTTINFTSEGGQIQPSCLTVNGRCNVSWTSTNPRVADHRITVMAYALGHETFFDTNGDNVFDDADGTAIAAACLNPNGDAIGCSGNGMDIETYHETGFNDLGDAFRDDNENFSHDSGEPFFNTAAGASYSGADGKFNGPQCEGSHCGTGQANKSYIRKALVMTMSGSDAHFILWQGSNKIYDQADGTDLRAGLSPLVAGASTSFTVQFFDDAGQIMPAGTVLSVEASKGELDARGHTVRNATRAGGSNTGFSIGNDIDPTSVGEPAKTSNIDIKVTTPKGIETVLGLSLLLQGT